MRTSTSKALAVCITGVLVGGVGVAQAGAATKAKPKPKPVCNLLTDEAGDAGFLTGSDSMDIISADVATSAKNLAVALRVTKWADSDTNAPLGRDFYVTFKVPGLIDAVFLEHGDGIAGSGDSYGTYDGGTYSPIGAATSVIDKAKGTITITTSLAALAADTKAIIKPGTKLTELGASATTVVGAPVVGGVVFSVDTAENGKSYTAGAPSCVKVA